MITRMFGNLWLQIAVVIVLITIGLVCGLGLVLIGDEQLTYDRIERCMALERFTADQCIHIVIGTGK